MKKTLSIIMIIAVITALFTLAGCGENKNSAIVGEWIPASATINGETVQFAELDVDVDKFGFVFNDNGSCEITIDNTKNNGTYSYNETSVDIDYGGKSEKLIYSDGMLTMNFNYNNETTSFMFTKKTDQ